MKKDITISANFDNKKSWSGLQNHMARTGHENHANKTLNTALSKHDRIFNCHEVLLDKNKFLEQHFGAYVKEHDENSTHYKYGSAENFLKVDSSGKKRKLEQIRNYYFGFSSLKDYRALKEELIPEMVKLDKTDADDKDKEWRAEHGIDMAVRQGLMDYAQGFNQRNPNLKMFEFYIHVDEKGALHGHSAVLPYVDMGKAKSGKLKKPSTSLNTALQKQYGGKRGKANLVKFRKLEDTTLLNCVQDSINKEFPELNISFNLVRRTEVDPDLEVGLDHNVYIANKVKETADKLKESQQKLAEKEAKLNTLSNQIDNAEDRLENIDDDFVKQNKANLDKLDEINSDLDKREDKLNKRENNLVSREVELNSREIELRKRKKWLDEREDELDEWFEKVKKQYNVMKQRVNDVTSHLFAKPKRKPIILASSEDDPEYQEKLRRISQQQNDDGYER